MAEIEAQAERSLCAHRPANKKMLCIVHMYNYRAVLVFHIRQFSVTDQLCNLTIIGPKLV